MRNDVDFDQSKESRPYVRIEHIKILRLREKGYIITSKFSLRCQLDRFWQNFTNYNQKREKVIPIFS